MTRFDAIRRIIGRRLLPSRDRRLLDRARRELLPDATRHGEGMQMLPGIDPIDLAPQLALLEELEAPRFQDLFAVLRSDPGINRLPGGASIQNGYFPTPDAELYAAHIVRERPRRIIEVGSGFSTAIARAAITFAGLDTEIHVIDPAPRRSVEGIADSVEYRPVEQSSIACADLGEGVLLFIDSSHVTRSGGDGPFLYLSLLPHLPPNVLVHVHDVFLPYDYPTVYREWLYTEQYLLQALLANSRKFTTVFPTYLVSRRHPESMRAAFGDGVARDGTLEGASYWIRSVE